MELCPLLGPFLVAANDLGVFRLALTMLSEGIFSYDVNALAAESKVLEVFVDHFLEDLEQHLVRCGE